VAAAIDGDQREAAEPDHRGGAGADAESAVGNGAIDEDDDGCNE
jgi:hypothetical protein